MKAKQVIVNEKHWNRFGGWCKANGLTIAEKLGEYLKNEEYKKGGEE